MENLANRFWERWDSADELEKGKLIEQLNVQNAYIHNRWWDYFIPGRVKENKKLCNYSVSVIVNSYLVDLANYIRRIQQ